jgi:hypothetical protein
MNAGQFFLLRHKSVHGSWTKTVLGESEEHIRARPHPVVNSIAWLLWHVARSEDMALNRFVGDRSQVLDDAEWMPRLGIYRRDIGLGMTFEEVDDLSRRIDLDSLRAYWESVGHRTVDVVTGMTSDDFDRVNDAPYVRQVIFDEGAVLGEHQSAVHELWSGMSRGHVLGYLGLTHTVGHLSDADIIRALWGHPGRWSSTAGSSARVGSA